MVCIYLIVSLLNGKRYIGSSREDDGGERLFSHNSGKTKSTKSGKPWKIVYEEKYISYTEARKRELFLKSGQGRKILKEILDGAEGWPSGLWHRS